MKMLVEKHFHLVLIDITHFLGRDCNLVSVFVAAFFRYCVDIAYRRAAEVEYTEATQVVGVDSFARIVILALITLTTVSVKRPNMEGRWISHRLIVKPVCLHFESVVLLARSQTRKVRQQNLRLGNDFAWKLLSLKLGIFSNK